MKTLLLVLVIFLVSSFAQAKDNITNQAFKQYYGNLSDLNVEIAGTGWGHVRTDLPGLEGQTAWCFAGIPMYDRKSRLLVGEANDCLIPTFNADGSISVLPGFTFLDFFAPDGNTWTLMVSGNITVQADKVGSKTAWGMDVTHITGSSAQDNGTNNTCVGGSGPFDEAKCVSRISGMVNMSQVNPNDIQNSKIVFSCWFGIEGLELQNWAINNAANSM